MKQSRCSKYFPSINHLTSVETGIHFHIALTSVFSLPFKGLHLIRKLKKYSTVIICLKTNIIARTYFL